jgi:hypothetical protein
VIAQTLSRARGLLLRSSVAFNFSLYVDQQLQRLVARIQDQSTKELKDWLTS